MIIDFKSQFENYGSNNKVSKQIYLEANPQVIQCYSKLSISDFKLNAMIGRGSFGKVLHVTKLDNNKSYAIKVIKKEFIVENGEVEHTKAERKIMEIIDHPFIIKLRYAFQSEKKLYLVMDYCPGGELYNVIKNNGRVEENLARFYAAQILLALEELHKNKILYRDLKPENILLEKDGYIKLTDFGLSKLGDSISPKCSKGPKGTAEYLPPEILNGKEFTEQSDWWTFGILIFEMLVGRTPFYSSIDTMLMTKITLCEPKFPSLVSSLAKDLILKLLAKDPLQRIGSGINGIKGISGIEEIKAHPWFQIINFELILKKEFKPLYIPKISSGIDIKLKSDELINSSPSSNCDKLSSNTENNILGFSYNSSLEKEKNI